MESPHIWDILVIGAGHAGIEASLACARMGLRTLVLTMSVESIGRMSCNPAIGGVGKGQLVREIDAMGGEMGKVADASGIQFRMLNTRKGPAVRSPRAQCDKYEYSRILQQTLLSTPNLSVIEDTIEDLLVGNGRAAGVVGGTGRCYRARAVIVTTGTFLKAVQHCGEAKRTGGRINEPSAEHLSDNLRRLGFEIGRLKTGTPPRLRKSSLDFDKMQVQHGDPQPEPFSHFTEKITQPQTVCWITATNSETHEILRANLHRAPMYSGQIRSRGPRYCPSVEDKVVRFAEKDRHQLFIEPESLSTDEIYCNGISTSTPPDVQEAFVRTILGLEHCEFLKYGYAVEYDFAPPHQLRPTLETRLIENLYFAGQINGTSGYEEAAAQGFVAGVNAALKLSGRLPFILRRNEAYIGVLVDDLISHEHTEPYRMFTSRAEYRLLLRTDNADRRLMKYGRDFGLISDSAWRRFQDREGTIADTKEYLRKTSIGADSLEKLLKRPEVTIHELMERHPKLSGLIHDRRIAEEVEIDLKYEGYITRQNAQVERFKRLEEKRIPEGFDFWQLKHLRYEAKEKLTRFRPGSLGQAGRIAGVTPADLQILMVHLR